MITSHACRILACSLCFGVLGAETPPEELAPLSPTATGPAQPAPLPAATTGADQSAAVRTVPYTTKAASSTSTTKQFTVYGGDLEMRGAFCLLCEDTAMSLGKVLKDGGQYVLPVIVVLKMPPDITLSGPPVTLNIGELTHGGFHLQINAELRTGFRTTDFTRELVRVLLAERILRNHQKLSTTRQNDVLPSWVMTGVAQALDYRSRSRPSALFSAVFKRGQVYSLDRILAADPAQLDALSRGIYETSTCALVLTLLEQPDGPVRFSKFLNALAVESKSDRDLLTQHFPNLATSKSALEKWWSLQMAAMATPTAMETLGAAQTEEELENALTLLIPGQRKHTEERPTVAATPPPPPPPPPVAEPEVKKSRGFFGFGRRAKEEPKAEEKQGEKPSEAQKPQAMSAPVRKGWPVELPGDVASYLPLLSYLSSVTSPFMEGHQIGLFKKKPKPADTPAEPEPEKSGKKPAPAPELEKKEKPAADPKPSKGKPSESPPAEEKPSKTKPEEAAASLSRKPGETRSVGGRPDDLPKAPPPTVTSPAPEPEPPPADEAKSDKPSKLNPFNWFRKDPKPAESEPVEASAPPAKPEPLERSQTASTSPKAEPKKSEKPDKEEEKPAPSKPSGSSLQVTKAGTIPLEDYALIAKRSDRSEILTRSVVRLNALKLRAHPLYKPVIASYIAVVEDLREGKTKGAATKLEELRRQRQGIHDLALAVETHLDWFEANNTGSISHAFDDYLRLDEEIVKDKLPRNDDLSKYLDAVQGEFK